MYPVCTALLITELFELYFPLPRAGWAVGAGRGCSLRLFGETFDASLCEQRSPGSAELPGTG